MYAVEITALEVEIINAVLSTVCIYAFYPNDKTTLNNVMMIVTESCKGGSVRVAGEREDAACVLLQTIPCVFSKVSQNAQYLLMLK